MKRFLSLIVAMILVLSMVPAVSLAAEPVTVYIDPKNGSNSNPGTEAEPVQNFTTAYSLLQEGGGTVIMLSTVYYAGAYTFPACDYPVTVRGKTGAEGIRTGSNIIVSGDTTFQNMTFTHLKASTGTVISGNGHKLTMGENITVVPFVNDTDSYYFCLQGGHPSNAVENTDLTVLSGQYRNIYAGGYTKNVTGDAKLTMTGGIASTVAAGYSGSVGGNVELSISGSAQVSAVYAGAWTTGNVSGNSTITLGQGATFKNLFAGTNGKGGIVGLTTVTLDGYDGSFSILKGKGNTSCTGTLGGSRLVLSSGKLSKTPTDFDTVDVDIPENNTLTVACQVAADTLKAAGNLNFSGAAALEAASVTGAVRCTVEGEALKNQVYVTAPAGSDITFPAETGVTEQSGKWVNHDLNDFSGLVVKTDAANKLNLYGGIWAQGTSTVYTVVTPYATETVDGYTYRYYPNAVGSYHVRASRSGYITQYKNIYMSDAEAAARTVEEIVLDQKGTEGFVPQTVYSHTTEVLDSAWKSEASMFPKYEKALINPVFDEGRDPHQMTTQAEMEAMIASLDKPGDDMYVFSLGTSGAYGHDIPAVIFTRNDLSSATTLAEAAALMDDDRVTVYYRAQMHGNEPAGSEGALAFLSYLQQGYGEEILDTIHLIIVPRLSPDGSQLYQRLLPSGVNPNRDQLRLESAEMQALQAGYLLFQPEIVLDGHERVWNNQAGDIQVSASFTTMNSDNFRTTALELDQAAFRELEANGLCGYYYAAAVNGEDPNMGSAYYAMDGTIYVLMESRGIHGGNEAMERRAISHMAAVTGMLDYISENAAAVKTTITDERAAVVKKGATYEESDLFVLDTDSRTTNASDKESWGILHTDRQTVDWSTGEVTFPTRYPAVSDVVVRTRVAPTAYVIPADAEGVSDVLALMDRHGIAYSLLPAGATVNLQHYGGTTTEATLSLESLTRFAGGCYVFTMNQEKGLVLATLMEPDHTNALEFSGTLAKMGILSISDTYRYVRDLNEQGTVDYTVTDEEIKTVTVYLDGTNGDDTADGLSEEAAVKTLQKAYDVMAAAMEGASESSWASLVVVGMYDLGAKQTKLPAADYKVVITGKTASDGFQYTGGTSQATRTFELQGDTTFLNMTIHINNSESFNYFLANGHKLVIGQGMNITTNKANCYFTLAGGSYDYTAKVASADVTVRSGKWRTIYAGGYRGSVTGTAKLDVSDAWVYNNIAATYCGNVGNAEITLENTEVKVQGTSAIYMGPLEFSASYKVGTVLGNSTLTLGENVTASAVYGSSRTKGNIEGDAIVIVDGADLTQVPVVAMYPTTPGTTGGHQMRLGADITGDVTLDAAYLLDLNGYDITGSLAVDGTLTVKDSATDDYDVSDGLYGEITGTVTGTLAAADGYVAAAKGFHKFDQYISGVSLRPSNAGIYYTATVLADEVLRSEFASQGVAVSLTDLPGSDFETDEDTLYATGSNGVLVQNILTGDSEDADRGITDIYAASYVKLQDGTVLVSDETVAYSLYDVLLLIRAQSPDALNSFLTKWNIQSWFH